MINLLKKNIPSFLSFTTTTNTTTATATATATVSAGDYKLQPHQPILGLGLINASRVTDRTLNVLESATLKPNNNSSSPTSPSKRIEFIDNFHGEVDRLMCCTESLGFESSNERRVNDESIDQTVQIHSKNYDNDHDRNHDHDNDDDKKEDDDDDGDDDHVWRRRMMMSAEGRGNWKSKAVRSFPPPLSWLNRDGKPSFILRPMRKDGRLELTEVRIHRPEILHASRHDGRLTLHLIPDHSIEEEEELEQLLDEEIRLEQEVEEEEEEEEDEELDELLDEELMVGEEEGEVVEGIRYGEEEKEKERCNEGLRRCYQMMNQHHHRHVHENHHHHHHMRMCGINISVPC